MDIMKQITVPGRKIEKSSFEIIDQEIGEHSFDKAQYEILRRIIHTTGDFEFKELTKFSPTAIEEAIKSIQQGCNIIADVKMIEVGVNTKRLEHFNCKIKSFISDDDVIQLALENETTRAIESIRKAKRLGILNNSIIAIGNTPTSLIETIKVCKEEGIAPALIIGVPVGFVSAVESKDELLNSDLNFILTKGRKGGSTIAVAIIHALLTLAQKEK